jgi:hypothetical protein
MDLHLHTPASVDYREANVTYLAFLKKAEERGLDIVAFTDHNTVAGYERYLNEVESLELLERLNRLTDSERTQLAEYRRLQENLLILPGFELTATLGFHILAIFPPETSVRELEHLLLDLRVPPDKLDLGSGEVGATSDVLTAYRLIDEAGGLVVAAHANSSHGVAMPGFDFGGQTRISYTQDSHLHALEVTDLTSKSRRRTALFFSGTKPEYRRRMHLIQSSDAHRLTGIPGNNQELGVGDRATEILLDELAFEAIKAVFIGNDYARVRPYEPTEPQAYDPILQAREEGETLVQAFHEHLTRGRGIERKILQDVVALANTNGGTIYIGLGGNPRAPIVGVQRPSEAIHQLKAEIAKYIVPPLEVQLDSQKIGSKSVVRIIVPRGSEVPYALDGTQIYVRSENETSLAVRDEIVNLVRDVLAVEFAARPEEAASSETGTPPELPLEPVAPPALPALPPRTGVQVIPTEKRRGETQYSVRDLRNNRLIHNVTRSSARKLWQYAISEYEEHPIDPARVKWLGDIGLCSAHKRAGKVRYDLVQRDSAGQLHIYYGVTEDGIHGPWKALIESEGGEPSEVAEVEEVEQAQAPQFVEADVAEPLEPEFYASEETERAQHTRFEPSAVTQPELERDNSPESIQVAPGSSQGMHATRELVEPDPSKLGYSESHPITALRSWFEQVPPGSPESSEAERVVQPEALEPEKEQLTVPTDQPELLTTPGRSHMPPAPAEEAPVSKSPLEISRDNAKMELPPATAEAGQAASAAGEAVNGMTPADVPNSGSAENPGPEFKDNLKGAA